MTATVVIIFRFIAGSAAAGITKFHGGRAGFTMAWGARAVPVLLTTRAGVHGCEFVLIVGFRYLIGCWYCVFWHCVTNRIITIR